MAPDFTRSTGGWALSNQPHCVLSSVAGRTCAFLPWGSVTTRSAGSAGPGPWSCASTAAVRSAVPTPAKASFITLRYSMSASRRRPSVSFARGGPHPLNTAHCHPISICCKTGCPNGGRPAHLPGLHSRLPPSMARELVAQFGRAEQHENVVLDPPMRDLCERGGQRFVPRQALRGAALLTQGPERQLDGLALDLGAPLPALAPQVDDRPPVGKNLKHRNALGTRQRLFVEQQLAFERELGRERAGGQRYRKPGCRRQCDDLEKTTPGIVAHE